MYHYSQWERSSLLCKRKVITVGIDAATSDDSPHVERPRPLIFRRVSKQMHELSNSLASTYPPRGIGIPYKECRGFPVQGRTTHLSFGTITFTLLTPYISLISTPLTHPLSTIPVLSRVRPHSASVNPPPSFSTTFHETLTATSNIEHVFTLCGHTPGQVVRGGLEHSVEGLEGGVGWGIPLDTSLS